MKRAQILLVLFCQFIDCQLFSQNLQIEILGLENTDGILILNFHKNAEPFKNEKPDFVKYFSKNKIDKSFLNIQIHDLKFGSYGISLIDVYYFNHQQLFKEKN